MEEKKERHYYPIFDQKGKASYFLDQDKIHVYSWSGKPVAFIEKEAIFSFKKKLLGWLDQGWLRGLDGKCVGFTEPGRGGPNPPKAKPPADPPAPKEEPPELPEIGELQGRPLRKPLWSNVAPENFFKSREKPLKKAAPKKTAARKPAAKKKAGAKKTGKKK